jgi:hypothetical protein
MTQIGNRISGRLLETLEVSLASTPTTGYAWEIMSCPLSWSGWVKKPEASEATWPDRP